MRAAVSVLVPGLVALVGCGPRLHVAAGADEVRCEQASLWDRLAGVRFGSAPAWSPRVRAVVTVDRAVDQRERGALVLGQYTAWTSAGGAALTELLPTGEPGDGRRADGSAYRYVLAQRENKLGLPAPIASDTEQAWHLVELDVVDQQPLVVRAATPVPTSVPLADLVDAATARARAWHDGGRRLSASRDAALAVIEPHAASTRPRWIGQVEREDERLVLWDEPTGSIVIAFAWTERQRFLDGVLDVRAPSAGVLLASTPAPSGQPMSAEEGLVLRFGLDGRLRRTVVYLPRVEGLGSDAPPRACTW